jgi:hypothetical protein
MNGTEEKPPYFAYLLRFWLTRDEDEWVWRASLEYPATGERRGFASVPELMAYLQEVMTLAVPEEGVPTLSDE